MFCATIVVLVMKSTTVSNQLPCTPPLAQKKKEKRRGMRDVFAPSACVTGTSVPWQILLPVGLHSSRAGRHPLQPADGNVSSPAPPSPPLESIRCCSWSYYRYAPAKCKTSICHLSAHQPSSMKPPHNALPFPVSPSTHDTGAILAHLKRSEWRFDLSVASSVTCTSIRASPKLFWTF